MAIRKKRILDGTDKEILRNLVKIKRGLSGRQIAKKVGLSDSSIKPRLDNLKKSGYVKDRCEGFRKYDREFNGKKKKIRSCSKRTWTVDFD
ncbi:winged helix-turn-helix transcriptional regulator [Candidatus Pacearchaeota archaeon]|nr:winged helix-turn-helix transcriptional regulator [Candidatus Pacearchaeota archaeon]